MSSGYREKGRAVVLAALMVLSVVAMTTAFAGTAAAAASSPSDVTNDGPYEPGDVIEVSVDVGTSGNNVTLAFDGGNNGDLSDDTTGVNGTDSITVEDGGAKDLDGSADGSINAKVELTPSSGTFADGDLSIVATEGESVSGTGDVASNSFVTIDDTELVVDGDGGAEWTTIQDAIDADDGDDTILVRDYSGGTYDAFDVDKSVNVSAAPGASPSVEAAQPVDISSAGVTINGLDITSTDSNARVIDYDTGNNGLANGVIKNNVINDGQYGIEVRSGAGDSFEIKNNEFNSDGSQFAIRSDGTLGGDSSITGNTINDAQNGILVSAESSNNQLTIEDNVISVAGSESGIKLATAGSNVDNVHVISNTISDATTADDTAGETETAGVRLHKNTAGGQIVNTEIKQNTVSDIKEDVLANGQGSTGSINAKTTLNNKLISLYNNNDIQRANLYSTRYAVSIDENRIPTSESSTVTANIVGVQDGNSPSFAYEVVNRSIIAGNPVSSYNELQSSNSWSDVHWVDSNDNGGAFDPANDIIFLENGVSGSDTDNQYDNDEGDILLAGADNNDVTATNDFSSNVDSDWVSGGFYLADAAEGDSWDETVDGILIQQGTETTGTFSGSSQTFDVTPQSASTNYPFSLLASGSTGVNSDVLNSTTSDYTVENLSTTPSPPVFENTSVTVSGDLMAGSSGVSSFDLDLVSPGGTEKNAGDNPEVTTGDGSFLFTAVSVNDAGTYEVIADGNPSRSFAEFTVEPKEANLTLAADSEPTAGFGQNYDVILKNADGNAFNMQDDYDDSYINVTGPFEEDLTSTGYYDNSNVDSIEDSKRSDVDDDGNDETVWVQIQLKNGEDTVEFSATPVDADSDVTASLESDDGSSTYTGLEEINTGDATYDSPDYVADDQSLDVVTGDQDLVTSITAGSQIEAAQGSKTVTVEVLGSDGGAADGDSGNNLNNVTVALSGINIDTEKTDQESQTVSFSVEPDEAGTLTADVTAYADDGSVYTDSLTVDVTGDIIDSVDPTSVQIEDNSNITVEVTDDEGTPLPNREVILDANNGATLTVYDQVDNTARTGVSTVKIDGSAGTITTGTADSPGPGSSQIDDNYIANNGIYTVKNVTFTATGSFDVYVSDQPSNNYAEGGTEISAQSKQGISVTGVEAYEVSSNRSAALAGTEEVHTLNITEDGAEVNGTALDDFSVTSSADDTSYSGLTPVDLDEDGTNDALEVTLNATNASAMANVTLGDGNSRTGVLSLDVVEPEITTTLGADNAFTSKVYSPAQRTLQPLLTESAGPCESETPPACVYSYTRIHTVSAP
ncbi:beta strand repeat-containing protein [Halovenus marina]|uniref:beta strand repeat-containing protein n=1 Tax=Halovenus marina TaxID=3396621 RepID=UPI003F574C2E